MKKGHSSKALGYLKRSLQATALAALLALGQKADAATLDYTATFSGTVTGVNYDWADDLFMATVSAGNPDVIVISFSADPDTLVGQSSYTTSMNYSVTAGSFPTYTGSAQLTISLTQTERGTEFQFLNSGTTTNTNDAGVFRILETTTLSLTDVASILTLANQGTVLANNFSTFGINGVTPNSNALGTTAFDGTLGHLYSTGETGSDSYISSVLSTQNFMLTSTPEPSSAALLGAGATALYLLRRRKGQNTVDLFKLTRKDAPRLG